MTHIPEPIIHDQNNSAIQSVTSETIVSVNQEKRRNWLLLFVVFLMILLISLVGFFFYKVYKVKNGVDLNKTNSQAQNADELLKKSITEKSPILKRETKLIAFVRNGDIWIKNINKDFEELKLIEIV